MHYKRIAAAALCVSLALSGCSGDSQKKEKAKQQAALSRMLYSPNGEPLNGGSLGRPACREALSKWFERVDANHGGSLSREEFLADARLQFGRMDIDQNGYLVSEEVERFRQPYRQQAPGEIASPGPHGNAAQPQPGGHKHGEAKGDQGSNADEAHDDSDTSDPVMSADTDLDFKVTSEEFMIHAQKIFLELDSNHDGALSLDEVLARCGPQL